MSTQKPSYESDTIDLLSSHGKGTPLDESAKKLMSSREIIARLLKAVVPEFKGHDVETIRPLIGNVAISEVTVDADKLPPAVMSENTEDATVTEGTRFYDLKFTAKLPNKDETVFVIINIEIQNKYDPGYNLLKRATYYAARLISGQLNTVFKNSDYDSIQKVYSIWICTDPPETLQNTISHYYMTRRSLLGHVNETKKERERYRIPNIILVNLGSSDTKDCDGIIRMLYTLLVSDQTASEKKTIAHEEYGIPIDEEFDEEVENMCNISSMYLERGEKKGIEQGRLQMLIELVSKKLLTIEQAAAQINMSVKEFKKIANIT